MIEMDQVPKVLKPMVQQWAPEGFVVSFKLETDTLLLLPKAAAALHRYGHQIVIANDLHTRKDKVCFVTNKMKVANSSPSSSASQNIHDLFEAKWLELPRRSNENCGVKGIVKEIEENIVAELLQQHDRWIAEGKV